MQRQALPSSLLAIMLAILTLSATGLANAQQAKIIPDSTRIRVTVITPRRGLVRNVSGIVFSDIFQIGGRPRYKQILGTYVAATTDSLFVIDDYRVRVAIPAR